VAGEGRDPVERVDAGARGPQRLRVDVSGVDQRAREQPVLVEEDGERVDLFAGAAAGDPHPRGRVGGKRRQHVGTQRAEVGRVAEELADRDGQNRKQPGKRRRIAQRRVLQILDRGHAERVERAGDAAPHRRPRVLPEVIGVALVHGLEQGVELGVLDP
jgi:hypothetical protein